MKGEPATIIKTLNDGRIVKTKSNILVEYLAGHSKQYDNIFTINKNLSFEGSINKEYFELLSENDKMALMKISGIYHTDQKEVNKSESKKFNFSIIAGFVFLGNYYSINQEIINELYIRIEKHIEEVICDISWKSSEIDFKLKHIISKNKKIDFLEKKYNFYAKIFTKDLENKLYENEEFNGFNNWKDFICQIFDEELYTYLTEGFQKIDFNSELMVKWAQLYEAKSIMEICRLNLNTLLNSREKYKKPANNILNFFTPKSHNKFDNLNERIEELRNAFNYLIEEKESSVGKKMAILIDVLKKDKLIKTEKSIGGVNGFLKELFYRDLKNKNVNDYFNENNVNRTFNESEEDYINIKNKITVIFT